MKISVITLATLVAAASAQYGEQPIYGQYPQPYGSFQGSNKYSPAEAAAWHHCVDGLLDQINRGHQGTKLACSFWTCLENVAGQYNRGGALAALGSVVNPVCKLSGFVPDFI